jgi:hypothetical protein
MKAAEDVAALHGFKRTAVIAGVGTREYYKNKCGYTLDRGYMVKPVSYNRFWILRFILMIIIGVAVNYFSN